MPQMSPMNWLSLYLFFLILYFMMMIMNYYMFLYSPIKSQSKTKMFKNTWKW